MVDRKMPLCHSALHGDLLPRHARRARVDRRYLRAIAVSPAVRFSRSGRAQGALLRGSFGPHAGPHRLLSNTREKPS